ncbi:MAG: CPBP family intramembrane glutamic endopeptidase [Pseudomonadota bacterium]
MNVRLLGGIYFVLFVAAVWLGGTKNRFRFPEAGPDRLARYGIDLILALAAAAIVIFATRVLTRRVSAFREMARLFREILGPLNREEIFLVSAFSAVAEEFFFRGFLQAVIGFVPTSVFFGLLHVGPGRKFIPWTLFAVTLGFALGGLYAWRGNLLAPVVMHFAINFGNLLAIQRPVPDPDQGAGSS